MWFGTILGSALPFRQILTGERDYAFIKMRLMRGAKRNGRLSRLSKHERWGRWWKWWLPSLADRLFDYIMALLQINHPR